MVRRGFKPFVVDEAGVTSIEYALLAALIAVVCTMAVSVVGTNTRDLFMTICNAVSTAVSGAPKC
jgi:pilus assembly protein Flp/PilA